MTLGDTATTYVTTMLTAGVLSGVAPPDPTYALPALAVGVAAGLALSRYVVLPLLARRAGRRPG
jgi:hypothetical protein